MTPREQQTELSAEVERKLRALDQALAGLPVDNDLEDVAEIARALRTERPEPGEDFIEDLDAKAAAGFAGGGSRLTRTLGRLRASRRNSRSAGTDSEPGRRQAAPSGPQWPSRGPSIWRRTAGAGAVLALVVGAVVAVSINDARTGLNADTSADADAGSLQSASPESSDLEFSTSEGAGDTVASADSAAADTVAPEAENSLQRPKPGTDTTSRDRGSSQSGRKVQRDAQIALSTAPDDVRRVADESIEVIEANEGIVLNSEIRDNRDDSSVAELNVNVPAERLTPTLSQLSDLAMVESRRDATEDITSTFRNAQTRLQDFQAERESLLTRLADATTDQESESIRRRLRIVDGRIATARTALNQVERRADLATINLTVRGNGSANPSSTIDAAADDAVDVLKFLASVGIVAAAAIVPLGALLLIGWLIRRQIVHGRRERALDS